MPEHLHKRPLSSPLHFFFNRNRTHLCHCFSGKWIWKNHTLRKFQKVAGMIIFWGLESAAILPLLLKIYLKLEHFQVIFILEFGFSQPLWPSGSHFKCQNARLSEGTEKIRVQRPYVLRSFHVSIINLIFKNYFMST